MADMNVKGGYFAPSNYLKVNEGGSHEESPNGGVQIGVDQNGTPNMLEEGEPVYNDFVYSDNIEASPEFLEKHNLPKKYEGWLYSRIADDLFEEYSATPLDPISKSGADVMLTRLAECQEEQKQAAEQQELEQMLASLSPEEMQALEQELAMMQQQQMAQQAAPSPEEQMAMQQQVPVGGTIPMEAPQEQMMPQEQAPVMAAKGGYIGRINKYELGGPEGSTVPFPGLPSQESVSPLLTVPGFGPSSEEVVPPLNLPEPEPQEQLNPVEKIQGIMGSDGPLATRLAKSWDVVSETPEALGLYFTGAQPYMDALSAISSGIQGDGSGLFNNGAWAVSSMLLPGLTFGRMAKKAKNLEKAAERSVKYVKQAERLKEAKELKQLARTNKKAAGKTIDRLSKEMQKAKSAEEVGNILNSAEAVGAQNRYNAARRMNWRAANDIAEIKTEQALSTLLDPTYQIRKQRALNPMRVPFWKGLGATAQSLLSTAIDASLIRGLAESASRQSPGGGKEWDGDTSDIWGAGYANGGPVNKFDGFTRSGVIQRRGSGVGGFRGEERTPFNSLLLNNNSAGYDWMYNPDGTLMYPWMYGMSSSAVTSGQQEPDAKAQDAGRQAPAAASQATSNASAITAIKPALIPGSEINPFVNRKNRPNISADNKYIISADMYDPKKNVVIPEQSLIDAGLNDRAYNSREDYLANYNGGNGQYGQNRLSTVGRYFPALADAALLINNIAQPEDVYYSAGYHPEQVYNRLGLIDPRYMPVDANRTENALVNQNNGMMRLLANSGVGAGLPAAYIAADASAQANRGNARAQDLQTNNQLYNQALAGANANSTAISQNDFAVDRYNAQNRMDAQYRNIPLNLQLQMLNNQAESQKWAGAVSPLISRISDSIYGNATQNWNMNMVNSNPYFEVYGMSPDGWMNYLASAISSRKAIEDAERQLQKSKEANVTSCGGHINTKK